MAAVEGLFKLHPGWWVAVRRAVDREFRKGGFGGGQQAHRESSEDTDPDTSFTEKELLLILEKGKAGGGAGGH